MKETTICTGCLSTDYNGWSVEDARANPGAYCIHCGGHGYIVVMPEDAAKHLQKNFDDLVKEHHGTWDGWVVKVGRSKSLQIKYKFTNWIRLPKRLIHRVRKYQ